MSIRTKKTFALVYTYNNGNEFGDHIHDVLFLSPNKKGLDSIVSRMKPFLASDDILSVEDCGYIHYETHQHNLKIHHTANILKLSLSDEDTGFVQTKYRDYEIESFEIYLKDGFTLSPVDYKFSITIDDINNLSLYLLNKSDFRAYESLVNRVKRLQKTADFYENHDKYEYLVKLVEI